jgi:hypothetical protein
MLLNFQASLVALSEFQLLTKLLQLLDLKLWQLILFE